MHPESTYGCDIATITAVVARSGIVVVAAAAAERLPAGYEQVDVAILRWIGRETHSGRLVRH
jgi:hypothetical protein